LSISSEQVLNKIADSDEAYRITRAFARGRDYTDVAEERTSRVHTLNTG